MCVSDFEQIYERLGVKGMMERGESYYHSRMVDLVRELGEKGVLQMDKGCQLLRVTGCTVPLMVCSSAVSFRWK